MKLLPFDQLPENGVEVAMIEVLDMENFGLTVAFNAETYWVGEDNELYKRHSIQEIHDDLSIIAIENLFLHYPARIGEVKGIPMPFAEYTLIGQNLEPRPHSVH